MTTVDKILAGAKANSGSFCRFSRTKESVLLAVLANNVSSFVPDVVIPAFQKVADPVERVFEILNYYRDDLIKSRFGFGCLLGKLAFEIPETQSHIHQRIAFENWTIAVAKCLEDARERLPKETDLKARSTFILAVMGAVIAPPLWSPSRATRLGRRTMRSPSGAKRKTTCPRAGQEKRFAIAGRKIGRCQACLCYLMVWGNAVRRVLSAANSAARRGSTRRSAAALHPIAKCPRPRPRAMRLS